jgi:hypothetical protein
MGKGDLWLGAGMVALVAWSAAIEIATAARIRAANNLADITVPSLARIPNSVTIASDQARNPLPYRRLMRMERYQAISAKMPFPTNGIQEVGGSIPLSSTSKTKGFSLPELRRTA